jgi:tetratricopeptide (TPR) repeat protein
MKVNPCSKSVSWRKILHVNEMTVSRIYMAGAETGKAPSKLPDFDKLWDYDRPDVTERKFRELLPAALDSQDLSYFAQLLTQIARTEGLQRKFQDAHKTLDRVEKALPKTDVKTLIRYLLELGRVYNSSGKIEEARETFLKAFDLALKSKEDFYTADAAHMLGIVETSEKSLEWNLKALDLAENSTDERARNWKGSLYNNIGWTYFDQGLYEEALFMFEKALDYRRQQGNPENISVARWCVAKALRVLGHTEEAFETQQELLQEHQVTGRKSGFVYEELAECLLALGREQEAEGWFAAAYEELARDPSVANDRERISRLKMLGKVGLPRTM